MSNRRRMATLDFMALSVPAALCSVALLLASLTSLGLQGLVLGLDFTGGTLVEYGYSAPVDLAQLRARLKRGGHDGARAMYFGSERELLVRLPGSSVHGDGSELSALLAAAGPGGTLRRLEFVGPQVGAELRESGGLALLAALGLVMAYVAFRFQLKFAIGAVIALFHDVLITIGLFSLFRWEFDLTVLAALLAVVGYSLNDTLVISDRIRENFRRLRRAEPREIINLSLTQTLGRTLITSLTTLLVLLVLLAAGGELIRGFALALSIGVVIGTYSSIYVAASALRWLRLSVADLAPPEREGG